MTDARPYPLNYERPRRPAAVRVRQVLGATFAIGLALLWPLWAVGVVFHVTASAYRHPSLPVTDVLLIAATVGLPIGFGFLVAGPALTRRRRPRWTPRPDRTAA